MLRSITLFIVGAVSFVMINAAPMDLTIMTLSDTGDLEYEKPKDVFFKEHDVTDSEVK